MNEPTIRAAALLEFLALLDGWSELDSMVYGPEHNAGRREVVHQVRIWVMALIEPEVAMA